MGHLRPVASSSSPRLCFITVGPHCLRWDFLQNVEFAEVGWGFFGPLRMPGPPAIRRLRTERNQTGSKQCAVGNREPNPSRTAHPGAPVRATPPIGFLNPRDPYENWIFWPTPRPVFAIATGAKGQFELFCARSHTGIGLFGHSLGTFGEGSADNGLSGHLWDPGHTAGYRGAGSGQALSRLRTLMICAANHLPPAEGEIPRRFSPQRLSWPTCQ